MVLLHQLLWREAARNPATYLSAAKILSRPAPSRMSHCRHATMMFMNYGII